MEWVLVQLNRGDRANVNNKGSGRRGACRWRGMRCTQFKVDGKPPHLRVFNTVAVAVAAVAAKRVVLFSANHADTAVFA